ncbi:septal ring lytic transglycosylase RlpA family protein [Simiduia litorea]|uniref:septal ring lytic transglycosylase RlpA family protein n=1 Tax=Simiduia litorea TaxID=1435348 RepID=UPI0036F24F60
MNVNNVIGNVNRGLMLCLGLSIVSCINQPAPKATSNAPMSSDEYQATRYDVEKDFGPDAEVDVSHVRDAIPKVEPRTSAGNKNPYTVLGATYSLLEPDVAYQEEGMASWYGNKFHGHQTSNGEIYDMYGMTAAHKTLRIPTYVKVTNLDNLKTVVVRVNDRGPFHGGRIIDLSYAAASKLGYVKTGTARVRVEAINVQSWVQNPGQESTEAHALAVGEPTRVSGQTIEQAREGSVEDYPLPSNTYLQAGAFSSKVSATEMRNTLGGLTHYPVFVTQADKNSLYRVRIGPILNNFDLVQLRDLVFRKGGVRPHMVQQ